MKNIKELMEYLTTVSDEDIDMLSSDYVADDLSKNQAATMLKVSTHLYGKDTFTEKELSPFIVQASTWFVLEKFRRENLITIDDKGVPHRTKFGEEVAKHIEKEERKCKKCGSVWHGPEAKETAEKCCGGKENEASDNKEG